MCSFLITNKEIDNIEDINFNLRRRGPDLTNVIKVDDITYIHNLLHITGEKTVQPLVKNGNIFLYNGEAYGYTGKSDTQYIFEGLEQIGIDFFKTIDGEYAIYYQNNQNKYIVTDIFGTKPIFYAKENNKFGVSSYYSVLLDIGFSNIKKCTPNTIFNITAEKSLPLHSFNLNQEVDNYDIWESAFIKSVEKRITDKSFLCLSSGYDSGAIALAIKLLGKVIPMFCFPDKENKNIIIEREKILGNITYITTDEQEYTKHYNTINNFCDTYMFSDYSYKQDKAAVGLSLIFNRARKMQLNVSISGSGADEILSDYGIDGRGVFFMDNSSTIKGIFPENLEHVFPWENFYRGRQERYLYKEEAIASFYGIETRYPFLDKNCVQSFLNLKSKLKNNEYKAPIANFFKKYNFPYEPKIKRGFNL